MAIRRSLAALFVVSLVAVIAAADVRPADAANQPVPLGLPWEGGQLWPYLQGPHPSWSGQPDDALDFQPADARSKSCNFTSSEWVVAAADGNVRNRANGLEIDHGSKFRTGYSHLENKQVTSGFVRAGTRLGQPGCCPDGGACRAASPHLHFYTVYEARRQSIVGLNLDGWVLQSDGCLEDGRSEACPLNERTLALPMALIVSLLVMIGAGSLYLMRTSHRTTAVVNATVDKVFDRLTDTDDFPNWFVRGGSFERASQGPVGLGAAFIVSRYAWPGRVWTARCKVTEFVYNERIAYQGHLGGRSVRWVFELRPDPGGTQVRYREEWEPRRLFRGPPMLPFVVLALPIILPVLVAVPSIHSWFARRMLARIETRIEAEQWSHVFGARMAGQIAGGGRRAK